MSICKFTKKIITRILSLVLISGLLLPDMSFAGSSTLTPTLAVQSRFKPILTRIKGGYAITGDEALLEEATTGFIEDVKKKYYNLLQPLAKEIGLKSQAGLKRLISEHLDEYLESVRSLEIRKKLDTLKRETSARSAPNDPLYETFNHFIRYHLNNIGEASAPTKLLLNTREMEMEILRFWADRYKLPADSMGGYVTFDKEKADLYALYVARERFRNKGVFYVAKDDEAIFDCLRILGVKQENIKVVNSSDNGEIDYDDLSEKISENKDRPAILCLNMGGIKGAIDDLDRVNRILKDNGITGSHIHYSASSLGIELPFMQSDLTVSFANGIDSISLPVDKFTNGPLPTGIVLTKKEFVEAVTQDVEYVGIKDTTVPGSRNGHIPLLFWLAMKLREPEGFTSEVNRVQEVARHIRDILRTRGYPDGHLNDLSTAIIFKKPSNKALIKKWDLSVKGEEAVFEVMPHMTKAQIADLVNDLLGEIKEKGSVIRAEDIKVSEPPVYKLSPALKKRLDDLYEKYGEIVKSFYGFCVNLDYDNNMWEDIRSLCDTPLTREDTLNFEDEALEFFADQFKIPKGDYFGGITAGGTWGNMLGILAGRERFPDGILYFSKEAHYSINKVTDVLNMDGREIDSYPNGEINYEKLEEEIQKNPGKPVILSLNIGTTMKGAIDDLEKVKDILKRNKVTRYHIHCDAALFGMISPFLDGAPEASFARGIDSIAVSGHKSIGIPLPSGISLIKRDYITPELERTIKNVATSKNGHIPVYFWQAAMKRNFKQEAEDTVEKAVYLYKRLKEINYPCGLNRFSPTVLYRRPSEYLLDKWQLSPSGDLAHSTIMKHMTYAGIDALIADLEKEMNDPPSGRELYPHTRTEKEMRDWFDAWPRVTGKNTNIASPDELKQHIETVTDKPVVEIDILSPKDIVETLKKGSVVSLDLRSLASSEDPYSAEKRAVLLLAIQLDGELSDKTLDGTLFAAGCEDLLQNSFVHGNKSNFDLPIFLDLRQTKGHNILEIYDCASKEKTDNNTAMEKARKAGLHGAHKGEWLLSFLPYKRQVIMNKADDIIGTLSCIGLDLEQGDDIRSYVPDTIKSTEKRLIILDVDDTLMDSEGNGIRELERQAIYAAYAEKTGIPEEEGEKAFLQKQEELGIKYYWPAVIKLGMSDAVDKKLAEINLSDYIGEDKQLQQILKNLKDSGHTIVVVSNSAKVITGKKVDTLGIGPYLDGVYTPQDLGMAKPDPEIFALIAERFGFKPEQAIAVGDSEERDLTPAKKKGMRTIHIKQQKQIYRLEREVKKKIDDASLDKECPWGQTFIETILIRAYEARRLFDEDKIESPNIIVGLETSWIPKEQLPYIQGLLNKLSRLAKERGLDNIIIRRRKGSSLANVLRDKARETGTPYSNMIILGDHAVLGSKAFDSFREGTDTEKWAFFAGVELPQGFPGNNYIRLLEMLTTSINLAFGKQVSLDNPFMQIIRKGNRSYRFIPKIEPYDFETLKQIYTGQLKAMVAA